ncbi:MAG: hypothetical protein EOO89_04460 [Pedobacter sp.]|nr:MAG: hypothetical protein EOO89_04460 [Pedobacter sp.]
MRNLVYALALTVFLFSCSGKHESVIIPRVLTDTERFNSYQEGDALFIMKYGTEDRIKDDKNAEGEFNIKFRDTTIFVQTNPSDPAAKTDKFSFAQYVNTQKTTILAQAAGKEGEIAPVYLINLNENKIEAISLSRPSKGAKDKEYTQGLVKVGKTGFIINNDFFVTNVNAKAYVLKRQNPDERIQGIYFNLSQDKQTLVFLTANSLYQIHYATNKANTQELPADKSTTPDIAAVYIASNYKWVVENNIAFLKKTGGDPNKIVDISSFK